MSDLLQLGQTLGAKLFARNWRAATAESCTGGGIAAAITAIDGSSQWFEYGVVTYSNPAKEQLLKVDACVLEQSGAVSEAVVRQMVQGVLMLSGAQLAVAVSGIAGPGGGSAEKPVGTVWFAWSNAEGDVRTLLCHFKGDRHSIQQQAVAQGLRGLIDFLP